MLSVFNYHTFTANDYKSVINLELKANVESTVFNFENSK